MATETNTTTTTTTAPAQAPEAAPKKKLNKRFLLILSILVIGGGAFGISKYIHAQHHEETDDAQIDGNVSPVIPRISGYVDRIMVRDNQKVKKGDTLLVLDDRDLKIKLEQVEAALTAAQGGLNFSERTTNAAQANVVSYQANVQTISAQIEVARIALQRATQDYNRYAVLIKDKSITQQQYEQALAAKETAAAQLQVLQEQRNSALKQTDAAASQTNATGRNIDIANATIKQRQADVDNAKLAITYSVIVAPEDGLVSKVNVQTGQYVQAGQSLFAIVINNGIWVTANFKETQLDKMKEGQQADVSVDALGGHTFKGKISSFSPATGARFSLLPPDNASGNFVKVVQRVPVKIDFTDANDALIQHLRSGMNVNVDVHLD